MQNPIKFGTDGWRAIIGQDYTDENLSKVIQAFCDEHEKDKNRLVILGYDRRFGSQRFAQQAANLLIQNGFSVLFSKSFCPTPCVSWMTQKHQALAGVVITASHNPYLWNGIKFKEPDGGSASLTTTQRIEERIDQNLRQNIQKRIEEPKKNIIGRILEFDPHAEYLNQIRSQVDLDAIVRSKIKIIFDPIHGSGAGYLSRVLDADLTEIRAEENPCFGGVNPEPIAKNLQNLMQTVVTKKADIGLATDGDADRIGAVDENGVFVDSQQIFALILRHLVLRRKLRGDVITTVSTTHRIRQFCKKWGLKVFETPIGFKYICEKFRSTVALMGGEESGGIAIPSHVPERDGILSALLLLEILATEQKPLSAILQDLEKELGPSCFIREDLNYEESKQEPLQSFLRDQTASNPLHTQRLITLNTLDGFKFIFEEDSWLLIRFSGTEPLLRLYAEANSIQQAQELIELGKKWVAICRDK